MTRLFYAQMCFLENKTAVYFQDTPWHGGLIKIHSICVITCIIHTHTHTDIETHIICLLFPKQVIFKGIQILWFEYHQSKTKNKVHHMRVFIEATLYKNTGS